MPIVDLFIWLDLAADSQDLLILLDILNRNPAHLGPIEPSNFLLPKAQTIIK
jgi:hypothetical protein